MEAQPSIAAIKALNGKAFAMLNDDELAVLNFYRLLGPKYYGVEATIINEADPANSRVSIKTGLGGIKIDNIETYANRALIYMVVAWTFILGAGIWGLVHLGGFLKNVYL